jgi:hypothetical protein
VQRHNEGEGRPVVTANEKKFIFLALADLHLEQAALALDGAIRNLRQAGWTKADLRRFTSARTSCLIMGGGSPRISRGELTSLIAAAKAGGQS